MPNVWSQQNPLYITTSTFSSEDKAISEKVKTIAGQTTFLCSAFCIIMMPEGQLIHWNLPSVGGREPKIAASDCHTIGLGCTVQLCFRASVCHLTDCHAAANLSGASWLESGLLLLAAGDGGKTDRRLLPVRWD